MIGKGRRRRRDVNENCGWSPGHQKMHAALRVAGVHRQTAPAAVRLQPRDLCGMQPHGAQSFLFFFFFQGN